MSVARGSRPRAGLWDRSAFVSLATLLYWTGSQALRPLLPLRLDELGANEVMVGALVALFPLAALLLAIPGGRLIDRIGVGRVVAVGLTGMVVTGVGFALAPSPAVIGALMLGAGTAELAVWISLQARASSLGTGSVLTRRLALFSLAWGIGLAAGPLLGATLYGAFGFLAVGATYATCGAGALACLLQAPRGDTPTDAHERMPMRRGVARMWSTPAVRVTLLASFVAHFVLGMKNSFYPLYLARAGLDVTLVGWLLAAVGLASLLVRVPLPLLVRRWGPGRVLTVSIWLTLVPIALVPVFHGFAWWLAISLAFGAGLGVNPPVTVELMARNTEPHQRGLAMGLRVTANRSAQVVQPLAFGAVVAAVGFGGAFAASGAFLAVLASLAGRGRQRLEA